MQTEYTLSVNNIDLYYEVHGNGFPLLLLHGFTGSGAALVPIFEPFTNTHQLIIPDLRGHGKSTNPMKKFTHTQATQDIFALLDHLNIKQCNAVGFSAGGNILLHMATQQPALINSMALVSTTPYYPKEARVFMNQFAVADRTKEEWEAMRKIHIHGDEQIRLLWQQAGAFGESYDDMNFTPPLLAQIKAKTLLVQGDRDPFYPVEITVDMYRHIPNAYLWIIPNGGHVPLSGETIPFFLNYLTSFFGE